LITDLEEKLKTQTSSDDKTLILTKTELESAKQKLTVLTDQNVQLTAQLTKLQQDVATKQLSVDSLRQTNKGLHLDIATLQQQLAQQTAKSLNPQT
jgi:hypothetical protein